MKPLPPILHLGLFILMILSLTSTTLNAQESPICQQGDTSNRYGVVAHLSWRFLYSAQDIAHALDLMAETGIGWVRLNWTWKDMQPEPGPFRYDQFDTVARLADERGINLLPILTAVPAWASTAPETLKAARGNLSPVDRYRPADESDWLTYVQNVVERYDGDGLDDAPGSPRVGYWEVWNEPNIPAFWPPKPDVEEYVNLLAATHEIIAAADPTATVVLGGLSGSGVHADGSGFLPDLYAAGGDAYFDVVSIHIYVHPTRGSAAHVQALVGATRAVMDGRDDIEKPLWLTEIGWSDAPNAWGTPTVAPADIAEFLTDVYTSPFDADVIFWYNFRNIFDGSPDVEHNFGLLRADFTPKPSFGAYQTAIAACQ